MLATCSGNITSDGGNAVTDRGVCWSTMPTPAITDNKVTSGKGTGSFSVEINGLQPNTTYYVSAYAANSAGTGYGNALSFTTPPVVTDIEGNDYATVNIGDQTWMAENLKTMKFNDNTAIPNIIDNLAWSAMTIPACCWYDNDPATNRDTYGAIYNWPAVNTGKLCPENWHIPTSGDWDILTRYLRVNGFGYNSGWDIAKSMASRTSWDTDPAKGAVGNNLALNNKSGFTAVPGGYRDDEGPYYNLGSNGYWWSANGWSSTEGYELTVWFVRLCNGDTLLNHGAYCETCGFSVRCVKD
jgi:uncharacterized protein (TIGR02145 family)